MPTRIISPDQLDAGAVVPQCLDNMYFPDDLLRDITDRGLDLSSREVLGRKWQATRVEYVRSLVYSPQIVVNRAFFINNPVLYRDFHRKFSRHDDRDAFLELMRSGVIVPYLFKGSDFVGDGEYDRATDGEVAVRSLVRDLDDVLAVRLAVDDRDNDNRIQEMKTRFHEYFVGLRVRSSDPATLNRMVSELFPRSLFGEHREIDRSLFEGFRQTLDDVAGAAWDSDTPITRESLYLKFVSDTTEGRTVSDGRFLRKEESPFGCELKKLFDLKYNTNLSDEMNRYTMAPIGLPGRSALGAFGRGTESLAESFLESVAKEIRDSFVEHSHLLMTLPVLSKLSMNDVLRIREEVETWRAFVDAQNRILQNPLRCLDLLPSFGGAFVAFQKDLSDWYYRNHEAEAEQRRYATFVGVILSVAGHTFWELTAGQQANIPWVLGTAGDFAGIIAGKRLKGISARLLVAVKDGISKQFDRNRSYTIELFNSQYEYLLEDIGPVLNACREYQERTGAFAQTSGMANTSSQEP